MEDISDKLDALNKEQEENWERYKELLPDTDDVVIVVLKGHLIIEEMLNDLVSRLCMQPTYLEKANLTFKQLMNVARSISLLPVMDEAWDAIGTLNTLRNKLAHSLEPKDINKYISELERFYSTDDELLADIDPPEIDAKKVTVCVACLIGHLNIAIPFNAFLVQQRKVV